MKRLMWLLGPVVAFIGSAGLFMFGAAAIHVFYDTLTFVFRTADSPDPLPDSLANLRWAVMSGMALAAGLVVSCAAAVMRPHVATTSRWLLVAAGVSLIAGAAFVASAVMTTQSTFQVIGSSPSAPKPEDVREAVQAVLPRMAVGHGILVLATVLLLAAFLASMWARPAAENKSLAPLGALVAVACAAVALGMCLLWAGIWLNGDALRGMLSDPSVTPKPAELGVQLSGMLARSLFASAALAALGVLLVLAAASLPAKTQTLGAALTGR